MGHPGGGIDSTGGDQNLVQELHILREQLAELQRSHDHLGKELVAERAARASLEASTSTSNSNSTTVSNVSAVGTMPGAATAPSVPPLGGGGGGPNLFRPQLVSVGDNFAPSPRQVDGKSPGSSGRLGQTNSARRHSGPCSPPAEAPGTVPSRTPPRSPTRRASSRGRPAPAAVGGNTGSSSGMVVVEISRQLLEMEERWQRICAETAALKAALQVSGPKRQDGLSVASRETVSALGSYNFFPQPSSSRIGILAAEREAAAAAAAAATAAVKAAAAANAELGTNLLRGNFGDSMEETRLCGRPAAPATTMIVS